MVLCFYDCNGGVISLCISLVIIVDPFFHYHKPLQSLYYEIKNERYQNDGIIRNFNYNAIITGTSMTENFKTSEFDRIFSCNSIKVPFSGGTYKEISDNVLKALYYQNDIKYVLRSLDITHLIEDKNKMRNDLGSYPVYLYNNTFMDDGAYILNKDSIKMSLTIIKNKIKGKKGGVTSFDEYANWNKYYKFGKKYVVKKKFPSYKKQVDLSDKEILLVKENIRQNVVEPAKLHPQTEFIYFWPPYSIAYWAEENEKGRLQKYFQAEKIALDMILECHNIKFYSFNLITDITTNFDNYKDTTHYGEWINSRMLNYIHNDIGLITKENKEEYLNQEQELLTSYPYEKL